jgi:transposase
VVVEVPSRFEISDELWAEVEPLIPARPRRRRYPGRKAIDTGQPSQGDSGCGTTGPGAPLP